MERRAAGPRGLPALTPFATLDVHAVPFLWPRSARVGGLRVTHARHDDLDEMATLWGRLAPARQLAPVLDEGREKRGEGGGGGGEEGGGKRERGGI
jgi:hypothetical protein